MPLPEILKRETLAKSRWFQIEALHLKFSNGVQRVYERLPAHGPSGIIVVALEECSDGPDHLMLIREYAAGFHEFQLTLPKGGVDQGEDLLGACRREMAEEIGYTADHIEFVKNLTLAPGHMGYSINVMFAKQLRPESLPGDEPEPPEVVRWPVDRLDELLFGEEFCEARAIAAISLCRAKLLSSHTDSAS